MPPKNTNEKKIKHDCSLEKGRMKCSGCELGLGDEATETIQSLQEKIENSSELLEDTQNDFAEKLHNQILQAKDDIDLRIECLKAELDVLRESYFKELDEQENVILNFARIDKRHKLDPQSDDIIELENKLKTNLKRIQDLFDYSFQITTSEYLSLQWRADKNRAIRINYETNIRDDIPNSKWKYIAETENFKKLVSRNCIELSDSFKTAVYLEDDLVACAGLWNIISIIDIVTCDEVAKISNEVIPTSIEFAPSKWLITAQSTTLHIRNLETMGKSLVTTTFEVKKLKSLGDKMIACYEFDLDKGCFVSFWSIENDKELIISSELHFDKPQKCYGLCALPNKKIAVPLEGVVKIYNYDKKILTRELKKWVTGIEYLRDSLVALTTDGAVVIYNYESGEFVQTLNDLTFAAKVLALKDVFLISDNGNFHICEMKSLEMRFSDISRQYDNTGDKTTVFVNCRKNRYLFEDGSYGSIQVFDFNNKNNNQFFLYDWR